MNSLTVTIAAVIAVGLIHFSYVDFRFRQLDGVLWFWLMNPAPLLIWLSRAAIAGAVLVALSIKFFGLSLVLAFVIIGLVLLHIASLIVLEIREHR